MELKAIHFIRDYGGYDNELILNGIESDYEIIEYWILKSC